MMWQLAWPLLAEGAPAGGGGGGGFQAFLPMLTIGGPILLLFWFLMIRPQQQEQKKRQEMLQAVKKNDRVMTIGGIHGVVTNINQTADEVTVKVDESSNTKLRMSLASIARVVGDEKEESGTST